MSNVLDDAFHLKCFEDLPAGIFSQASCLDGDLRDYDSGFITFLWRCLCISLTDDEVKRLHDFYGAVYGWSGFENHSILIKRLTMPCLDFRNSLMKAGLIATGTSLSFIPIRDDAVYLLCSFIFSSLWNFARDAKASPFVYVIKFILVCKKEESYNYMIKAIQNEEHVDDNQIVKNEAIIAKPEHGTFTDPRDGNVYRTVKIGNQVWLAENLAFDCEGSKVYGSDPANGEKYGRLYDWETAKKAVPPGWHLPSNEEWQTLMDFAGGNEVAGKKLKAASGWEKDGNGTDDYGFSALPGGYGDSDGSFYDAGYGGNWWSSTEYNGSYANYRGMFYSYEGVSWYNNYKDVLFSVRCLQDFNGEEISTL